MLKKKQTGVPNISLEKYVPIEKIQCNSEFTFFLTEDRENKDKFFSKVFHLQDKSTGNLAKQIENDKDDIIFDKIGYSSQDFEGNNNLTILYRIKKRFQLTDIIGSDLIDNTIKQTILIGLIRYIYEIHNNNNDNDYYYYTITGSHFITPSQVFLDNEFHINSVIIGTPHPPRGCFSYMDPSIPQYIAPSGQENDDECTESRGEKDEIYSFALIMFQLLTGTKEIFDKNKNSFDVFDLASEGVRPVSDISIKKPLMDLIEACWSCDPDVRPTSREIFEKLAFDQDYYLDNIDIEKLKSYIDYLQNEKNLFG